VKPTAYVGNARFAKGLASMGLADQLFLAGKQERDSGEELNASSRGPTAHAIPVPIPVPWPAPGADSKTGATADLDDLTATPATPRCH